MLWWRLALPIEDDVIRTETSVYYHTLHHTLVIKAARESSVLTSRLGYSQQNDGSYIQGLLKVHSGLHVPSTRPRCLDRFDS